MKCEGCDNILIIGGRLDVKTGYCYECRETAYGFNRIGIRPRHTEQKDRHTCNMIGASAAEFETNRS